VKLHAEYSEPEYVKDRQPYRIRIEGKDGQVIEIVEQLGGGFSVSTMNDMMAIMPITRCSFILRTKVAR